MSRILFVSNRLPVGVHKDNEDIQITPAVGGLATGLKSFYKEYNSQWIGWSGFDKGSFNKTELKKVEKLLEEEKCFPVYLSEEDVNLFYYGFSNETIWPLFHYFGQYTEFNTDAWEAYVRVNQQFADVVVSNLKEGDKVWIHDYQLLLLPKIIRDRHPDVNIGFFLHIPFPSFEVFRILPWRNQIIEGMLGADLIGFHTYDYERHFLSAVRRLIGYETYFNQIKMDNRVAKVDAFPMGIDYNRFSTMAIQHTQKSVKDKSNIQREIEKYFLMSPDRKLILSIDRLDYTKGIAERLEAYEFFLETYPQYRNKVTMVLLAVPSREHVEQYQIMKSEVDELVGKINGRFGSINWVPVWYFYRSMPFEDLIDLYLSAEIALITPIRDGMNLVAKEYIATKTDGKGVLILSERAGAAKEMSEASIVNPNNKEEVAAAIRDALEMPVDEQIRKNKVLQARLERYNVDKWARDFVGQMDGVAKLQHNYLAKRVTQSIKNQLLKKFTSAKKRMLFLDYDGTLVNFKIDPKEARPDEDVLSLLDKLIAIPDTNVCLISGRDKETFTSWFEGKNYTLIVEHGIWSREPGGDWQIIENLSNEWKDIIRPAIEFYVDRTPGTFIEEKNYSLVWHYRKADPDLGVQRALELKDELTSLVSNLDLEIMEGNKVIEIKNSGINKGRA
ncbi:MAG: bifunctional alpha,alpha-trehalose-phosphate synthase (UDP-forming)/trehalose-phosphatase, partial [Bacteroidota bacterium]